MTVRDAWYWPIAIVDWGGAVGLLLQMCGIFGEAQGKRFLFLVTDGIGIALMVQHSVSLSKSLPSNVGPTRTVCLGRNAPRLTYDSVAQFDFSSVAQ